MRKILIVVPSLEQGGGQKFVVDLAKGIDKNRFQVKVLVYYKESNSIFDEFVKKHNIDTEYLNKKVGLDLGFFKEIKKLIKNYSPDVIHTNLDCMLYLIPFYKKKHIKLHTVHSMADKESIGFQRLVRKIAYKFKGVVPVGISDTVADSIAALFKIDRNQIPVVYNGVDCTRYQCDKTTDGKLNFINVGTIYEVKNLSFLIDCFAELIQYNSNVHLTLVGDGILRPQIEEQVKQLNIESYVTITGVVSDVENYLSKSDVYVASSIYEGLPISMLEAMSAGIPVISTKVGGVPDIITDKNGILVELGNKEEYINALKEMVFNKSKRLELSKNASQSALKYDESVTVKGYEKLYES